MRSFSCWRATRVRARPLSPLLGAPALYTLILSAASTWGTPPSSRAEHRVPPSPLRFGRTSPLPFKWGAGGREQPGCHPSRAAPGRRLWPWPPLVESGI